ncbi:MAG: Rpn family recombination-promoting nuclease/putative transposase [Gemmataceae bacterium]|nr:Rpn family recombination-promoting nuclease/putative transposase [Gemmataceae bacterium]
MKTDALFYRLFQELPACYFEAIGAGAEAAEGYTFVSEELKQAGLRLDGVFLPKSTDAPVHFVEVYFYAHPNVYSNLFAKVFLWLETKNPAQDWHASVFFATRELEPAHLHPYRNLIQSDQVSRVYLDDLPEGEETQVGLAILGMIAATPEVALARAKSLLDLLAHAKKPGADHRKVIELVQTVVSGHFPKLGRKELERMLQIKDFRETKVYQEALEEGIEQGREETREEIALRLLKKRHSAQEVAELSGLSLRQVQRLRKNSAPKRSD